MQSGTVVVERDFFRKPFNAQELKELGAQRSLREIFSWKSPSAKALGLTGKVLTEDDLLAWMLKEPRLIRRPLIRMGRELKMGNEWRSLR